MKMQHLTSGLVIGLAAALVGCEPGTYNSNANTSASSETADSGQADHAAAHTVAKPVASSEPAAQESSDIVDTAVAAGNFSTLAAALTAADLVDTLKSAGPFTVFAPTDEAFAKLPEGTVENLLKPENKEQLVAILTYHVVPSKVDSAAVASLKTATTVNGAQLAIQVSSDGVQINESKVVTADIQCSNGIIHVVDSVLLPPASDTAAETHADGPLVIDGVGSFKTLFAAIEAAGLKDTLAKDGPFTVFAPTDDAFAALPEGTVESLLKPENKDKLVAILTYHVVSGRVPSSAVVDLPSAKTVNGAELPISVSEGKVRVGEANVIKTDIPCDVGLIHAIDKVLLP